MARVESIQEFNKELVSDLQVDTIFKDLMRTASGKDSMYIHAKETLLEYFADPDNTLSEREKAEMLVNLVSTIAIQATNQAMTSAINIAKENREGGYVITKLVEETKLIKEQADKVAADNLSVNKDIDLKTQQIDKVSKETDYVQTQTDELIANGAKDRALTDVKITKTIQDTTFVATQNSELIANGAAERALKAEQITNTAADTSLSETQRTELIANGAKDRAVKDGQITKLSKEALLIAAQKSELVANGTKDRAQTDAEIDKIGAEEVYVETQTTELTANGVADRAVKGAQKLKIGSEDDLLGQQKLELQANGVKDRVIKDKEATLKANMAITESKKPASMAKAIDVQEAQIKLYGRQVIGFDDNKEIKKFEAQANAWGLMFGSGVLDNADIPSALTL